MTYARDELQTRWPRVRRWTAIAAGGGAIVLAGCAAAGFVWPHAVLRSYLFAYVFWLNLALGSFGWLMLNHVTGGAWGRSTRRIFEAAAGTLPVLAVLGLPLIFGASHLFSWAEPEVWQNDPVLAHRHPWMSPAWIAARAAVVFVVWCLFTLSLRRASLAQDQAAGTDELLALGQRMRTVSQGGLVVLFATVFLLAVDWIMALEPHWISSVFGLVILMGQATVAISGVIVVLWLLERSGKPMLSADRVHDLGKVLLTSLVLWAYMAFAQYLVQWMGQTQEDIHWYTRRLQGGWSWVAASLCVLHLGVPMVLLLSQPLKRSLKSLVVVAAWIFAMRIVDVLWTIAPAGPGDEVGGVYLSDPFVWLGLGGVWVGVFLWHLSRAPLRPAAYLTSGANVIGVVVEGPTHG